MSLTHLDESGAARMVDIGEKAITLRTAQAQAIVSMQPQTLALILSGNIPKGDVFACARIAGIMASKRTWELIPMCHPILIEKVEVHIHPISDTDVKIVSDLCCTHKTGIEMEALTAVSIAALTLYDMCKAVDRSMVIHDIMLLHKTGGKSGDFHHQTTD